MPASPADAPPVVNTCDMYRQDPYPFAWCETHDETFPLGAVCPHYRFDPPTSPATKEPQ